MAAFYNKVIYRNFHFSISQASIFRSVSHDPYTNIALDDWFYHNFPLQSQAYPLLYIYRNHPCVVIGRHQNPWSESNAKLVGLHPDQVPLVRRRSGGGTVYHDLGNLNVTVVSHRNRYDRKKNLEMIADILKKTWNIDVVVNDRSSASRLGRLVAYHHFTLLFDSKLHQLGQMLSATTSGLKSKATASVRSPVVNLSQLNNTITYDDLCSEMASNFIKVFHPQLNNKIIDINPNTESSYPGITSFRKEMMSWDWIYGKTPTFEISHKSTLSWGQVSIKASVKKGLITDVELDAGKTLSFSVMNEIKDSLTGCRYGTEDILCIISSFGRRNTKTISESESPLTEFIHWLTTILGRE